MSELLNFYKHETEAALSNIPWVRDLQTESINILSERGFPNLKDEAWKYTSVDGLLKASFTENMDASEASLKNFAHIPAWVNGVVSGEYPKGVLVLPMDVALQQHADKIKPHLSKITHGFHALNLAMLHFGVFIYIPSGIKLEEPLVLSHFNAKNTSAYHLRHVIVLEEGSEATVVEDYSGDNDCTYFTTAYTDIALAKGAKLTHYKVQRESQMAYHIGEISVSQESKSQFDSHLLNVGGKLVRSDILIKLQGEHANCLLNGLYLPKLNQHMDSHTTVEHLVPNCQSAQDYKGILQSNGKAVFDGRVFVAKDAQHTSAAQQNKNLLLSSKAEINTKPQLDIFADDVMCTHGATVGQLDEDALFYLATRGIAREEAGSYLVHAFAKENLDKISHPELSKWMAELFDKQLG
jgi:Fe-S cluster assembly protein SufD